MTPFKILIISIVIVITIGITLLGLITLKKKKKPKKPSTMDILERNIAMLNMNINNCNSTMACTDIGSRSKQDNITNISVAQNVLQQAQEAIALKSISDEQIKLTSDRVEKAIFVTNSIHKELKVVRLSQRDPR